MFDLDKWQEIFGTIRQNKLRTFLTAFGVFWGIFMLMLLLGAGKGMQNGVEQEFAEEARNSIWVWEGKTSLPHNGGKPGRIIRFDNEDLRLLRSNTAQVEKIAPRNRVWGEYTITYQRKNGSYQVFGSVYDFFRINGEKLKQGRFLNQSDIVEQRKVIVIGEKVRQVLFAEALAKLEPGSPAADTLGLGAYVTIKGINFKVVGTFTSTGNNGRNEERAYIPFSTLQAVFNQPNQVQMFAVTPVGNQPAIELENELRAMLAKRHNFSPDDKQAIELWNNEENFKRFTGLFAGIEMFVWVVGIGTLIAGIIGVSNIMMIIVKERTKEIGVRKALGATPWSIVSLIIQESVFITGLAGYLGMFVGIALLDGIRYAIEATGAELPYFTRPEVDVYVAVTSTLILVLSGALAGLMPALQAANVKPIEALRAE
jgi:putative ABC transport system permease protein